MAAASSRRRGGRNGRSNILCRGQLPQSCRGAARLLYARRLRPRWHVRGWPPRRRLRFPSPGRRRPAAHPPSALLSAIAILRPETIIRWHRAGFQSYWRERSRKPVGRPRISAELRNLIGAMSRANHLWGAPHIHGELLKLGFTIAQSTVARYMYRGWPPSQGWRTFLTNHVDGIVAIDLFVLPTITFLLLYCLVTLRHGRRLWVTFGVTTNPTAEWIARQIMEAFPWASSPRYLIWDRDTAYGVVLLRRW